MNQTSAKREERPTQFLPLPRAVGWPLAVAAYVVPLWTIVPLEHVVQIGFVAATLLVGLLMRARWEYIVQQGLWGVGVLNIVCTRKSAWFQDPVEVYVYLIAVAAVALRWRTFTARNWLGAAIGLCASAVLISFLSSHRQYAAGIYAAILSIFCLVYGLFFIEPSGDDEPGAVET